MAVDPGTAAVIGAAIGASGAVGAQLVALWFTDRRENKRFNWEREQADAARVAAHNAAVLQQRRWQAEHFGEYLLDLFSKVLASTEAFESKLSTLNDSRSGVLEAEDEVESALIAKAQVWAFDGELPRFKIATLAWTQREFMSLYQRCYLVAPEVARAAEEMRRALLEQAEAMDETVDGEMRTRIFHARRAVYNEKFLACVERMHERLNTARDDWGEE